MLVNEKDSGEEGKGGAGVSDDADKGGGAGRVRMGERRTETVRRVVVQVSK
jgi:hypothetical protein